MLLPPGPVPSLSRRPPKRRYELRLPTQTSATWAASLDSAMASVFGTDPLGASTLSLFKSTLQPGSYDNYGSNLRGFLEFCQEYQLPPLNATPVTVARYITWLGIRGSVAATSLQPYLSAINRFLRDHNREPVALGPLVSDVRRGLDNCQFDLKPDTERVPLPAPVALSILELAESLLPRVHWDPSDPNLRLLRACVASVTAYAYFNRGECAALALCEDLVVDDDFLTLRLRFEKRGKSRRAGRRNIRQTRSAALPRVAALLRGFFRGTESMGLRLRRWALAPEEDTAAWSAETVSDWLRVAYLATDHRPPEGFKWTSHSLRKGAASAAYAIKVPLADIKYAGGWSTTSTVLEAKYIDFSMEPTRAAFLFFGHLLRNDAVD